MKSVAFVTGCCISGFILFLAGACAPILPPPVSDAHARAADLEQSDVPDKAADAWRHAQETLAKADTAARTGDKEAANHFSELAQIQMDIAEAEAERLALNTRAAELEQTHSKLVSEIERIQTLIDALEREQTQARLREHVVSVVSESRREAAVSEAYRARFRGEKSERARRAVAGQYLERAMLYVEIVEGYISLGVLEPTAAETLAPIRAALNTAFEDGDLFAVEERSSTLVAAAEHMIENAWTDAGEPPAAATEHLDARLSDAHISYERKSLGFVVPLGDVPHSDKRTPSLFAKLRPIVESSPTLIVVLSATPKEKIPASAEKRSREQAHWRAEQLGASGVDTDRIRARGCSEFAPFPSLSEGSSPALLLLVPVPTPTQKK